MLYTLYITSTFRTKQTIKYKRKRSGYPGQPFSVLLSDATFGNAFTILSAIHIAYTFCTLYVQCALKCGVFTKKKRSSPCRPQTEQLQVQKALIPSTAVLF